MTIEARTLEVASGIFDVLYPSRKRNHDGVFRVLNCADIYTEKRFMKTRMPKNGNFGEYCHEEYHLVKKHRRKEKCS